MNLEKLINKGKKFGVALGTSLVLLANAGYQNNNAYSQSVKETSPVQEIKTFGFPEKDLKVIEIPFWRIAYSEGITAELDISGNNKVIVFEHRQEEKSDIFLANIGSEEAIKLDLGPGFHREPSIDYRGRKIVFSSKTLDSEEEIYLADLDKMKLINLSNHPDADFQPSIDDNGEKVIFTSERNKKSEIYLVQLKKSKPEKLINFSNDKKSWYYFPQISGNGKKVVYAKEDARQSIWVKETENPYEEKLLEENHNSWYMDPQISRDGTRIAWTRVKKQESSNKKKVFLADIVTGDNFEISNGENSERPSISANGEYIAWLEGSAIIGEYEIKVQDTKTRKIEKLGISLPSGLLKNEYLFKEGVQSTNHFFRISPDGKFLGIFLPHESGAIYGIGNPHEEPGLMYTVDEKEIKDPKKKESLYGDD
ncbi:MAG: hypothetical protein Q8O84_05595 [Nanoarchaeota archaeon]|nr:hypothetical protein [Nanoarchaeota archaeon]